MSEWRTVSVGDLADPRAGAIAIGPFGSTLKSDMYSPSGVPVVRGQNLSDGPYIDTRDLVYVPEGVAARLQRSIVHPGDLVFPHRGAIGTVGLIRDSDYLLSSSMMKLSVDTSRVDPKYLLYYFRGPGHRELMMRASTVGTPGISQPLRSLRGIDVRLPPLETQRATAEVLGALDDKIEANRKLAATADALIRARFDELSLDRHGAADYYADGLEPTVVSDLFEVNPRRPKLSGQSCVYIDMASLPTSGFSISDWTYREPRGGAKVMNGDAVIARITPCLENGKAGFVDFLSDSSEIAVGSTEFIVIRSRTERGVPLGLAYALIRSSQFHNFAVRRMEGTSGRQRVSANELGAYPLAPIDAAALSRFGYATEPLFSTVRSLTGENQALAYLREALLPKLMSGQLRIREAEQAVAASL